MKTIARRFPTVHQALRKMALLTAVCAFVAPSAWATDGYFETGYGMKAEGRGGVSIAFTDDAFGGANDPATMAFAANQISFGADLFSPRRSASRAGLGPGLDGSVTSHRDWFAIPQFAYNRHFGKRLALGVTVYANGGMNTDYPGGSFNCGRGPANMLCGAGPLGVNLEQVIVAPTFAYAFTRRQSIGISPQLVYQIFSATGLQAFAGTPGVSSAPGRVTNRGHEGSSGAGLRIGYYARISTAWSVGATFATRAYMRRFRSYSGLFADQGRFDLPENYGVGVAWRPSSSWTIGADYERIKYSGVASVGNASTVRAPLGSTNGPGFGWHDVNVWKLGVDWRVTPSWTWRAGFNYVNDPISPADVTFNILAPGVVTSQATLGFTHTFTNGGELTMAYLHAFPHSQSGTSILPTFLGGAPAGIERIAMHEDTLGLQYTWTL
ncbi:MAG TPA: outer membrane protein transport protein [Rhodanobacteraceae bacterium]